MEIAVNCKLILYAINSIIMVSDKDHKVIETKLAIEYMLFAKDAK